MGTNRRMHNWTWAGVLSFALLPISASAISVTITVGQWPMCDQPTGRLVAEASGGTEPYTYDWFLDQGGVYIPICTDCGSELDNLGGGVYMVVVTDMDSDEASEVKYLSGIDNASLLEQWSTVVNVFSNLAGGMEPYLLVRPQLLFTSNDPSDLQTFDQVTVSATNAWNDGPPPTGSYWDHWLRTTTPSGTITITFSFDGQQCVLQTPYYLPQPATVMPELEVIDLAGSCSNASTGYATIMVSDGVFGQYQTSSEPGSPTASFSYRVWRNGPGFSFPGAEYLVDADEGPIIIGPATTWFQLTGLSPGTHSFYVSPAGLFASPLNVGLAYDCYTSIEVTIPDLGPTCGELNGRVFVDNNLNCTSQTNEAGVPGVVMEVLPGPLYTNTTAGGQYSLVLPTGSYTVEAQSTVVEEHCSGDPLPFTITGAPAGTTVNHPMVSLVPFDGRVSLSSGPARPGFEYQVGMSVSNLTPSVSGPITVTLEFDAVLDFLSATPAPSNVSGNVLTWSQAQLTAFQSRSFTIRFQVPPDVGLLGTDLITTATLTSVQPDANPDNNTSTLVRTITGAYDPNDKLATTSLGSGNQWLVGQDEWIDYTIRFQNTGTDTAFHVIITDTLPSNLDPATLEMGAASHPFTWELKGIGVLKFKFLGILLPDSNINEPLSHGFVGFRIQPRLPLLPGDHIENIANIYFDFNPPVITEPSVLLATTGTGIAQGLHGALSIQPNPTDGILIVRMTGDDIRPGMLRVRSMDGRMVMEQRMTGPEVRMDVQNLANGAYVLELLNDNGPRSVARFVKQ